MELKFGRQIKSTFIFIQLISKLYKINTVEKTGIYKLILFVIENNEICIYLCKLYSDTLPAPANKRTSPW